MKGMALFSNFVFIFWDKHLVVFFVFLIEVMGRENVWPFLRAMESLHTLEILIYPCC